MYSPLHGIQSITQAARSCAVLAPKVGIIEGLYMNWDITIKTGRKSMDHSNTHVYFKFIQNTNPYLYIWGGFYVITVLKYDGLGLISKQQSAGNGNCKIFVPGTSG